MMVPRTSLREQSVECLRNFKNSGGKTASVPSSGPPIYARISFKFASWSPSFLVPINPSVESLGVDNFGSCFSLSYTLTDFPILTQFLTSIHFILDFSFKLERKGLVVVRSGYLQSDTPSGQRVRSAI